MREESLIKVTQLSAFCYFWKFSSNSMLQGTGGYAVCGLVGKMSTTREEPFGGSTELDLFVYFVGQVRLLHAPSAGA